MKKKQALNEPLTLSLRKVIVDALQEHSADEYESANDVWELAKLSDEELIITLIGLIDYYKEEANQ